LTHASPAAGDKLGVLHGPTAGGLERKLCTTLPRSGSLDPFGTDCIFESTPQPCLTTVVVVDLDSEGRSSSIIPSAPGQGRTYRRSILATASLGLFAITLGRNRVQDNDTRLRCDSPQDLFKDVARVRPSLQYQIHHGRETADAKPYNHPLISHRPQIHCLSCTHHSFIEDPLRKALRVPENRLFFSSLPPHTLRAASTESQSPILTQPTPTCHIV